MYPTTQSYNGKLTWYSDTRWSYKTGKRTYYLRRVDKPRDPTDYYAVDYTFEIDTGEEIAKVDANTIEEVLTWLDSLR